MSWRDQGSRERYEEMRDIERQGNSEMTSRYERYNYIYIYIYIYI